MTQPVCRTGDVVVGVCEHPDHNGSREFVGVWMTGSETGFADEKAIVRVGDVGITDCEHTFIAVTGSDFYFDEEKSVHRVGDVVHLVEGGVGVSVTGSDFLISS